MSIVDKRNDAGQPISFNGINGATGAYLLPPYTAREIAKIAAGEPFDADEINELKVRSLREIQPEFGIRFGLDTEDLAQAGWGVVFAPDITDADKDALSPLISLRKGEAGRLFQDFSGEKAYRSGDTKNGFLARCKEGPGPADPEKVPYYLLIVGSPAAIPYRFQYQLDVQRAVGRIHFETPDEYAAYASSVVMAAKGEVRRPRQVRMFGVRNQGDRATALSADQLVQPLSDKLSRTEPGWNWRCHLADEATKARLRSLLGGPETPSLFFSASHGMGFPLDHPSQLPDQGALLCQDWPGPLKHDGPIPKHFYFSATDIPADARLQGLIAFLFACYAGGTPQTDDFAHQVQGPPLDIARQPFIAALPRRLLGHPNGGALAVVAHVERAWSYSFLWGRAGAQLTVFEDALKELVNGKRLGAVMEGFNSRYAELSSEISEELQDRRARPPRPASHTLVEDELLAGMWTANNDARSYIVLGDPAVRLAAEAA